MGELSQPFPVVCVADPAIDLLASRVDKYLVDRDLKHIAAKPGVPLERFWLRRISRRLMLGYVEHGIDEKDCLARAFRVSLVRVDNLVPFEGGAAIPSWEPAWRAATHGAGEILSDDELELFSLDQIYDVGAAAYSRAFLTSTSGGWWSVPRSSLAALERATCPPVERILAELDQSNDGAKERLLRLLDGLGALGTGATAKASESSQDMPDSQESKACNSA